MTGYLSLTIILFSLAAFYVGRSAATRFAVAGDRLAVHSRPIYHGAFAAIWVGLPALVLVLVWLLFQDGVVRTLVVQSLPPSLTEGASSSQISLFVSEIRNVAAGRIFAEPRPEIAAAAERYASWTVLANWAMVVVALCMMALALFLARVRISPRYRARQSFERALDIIMISSAALAILVTFGIIVSLTYEAIQFFRLVPPTEFFFGLNWEPQIAIRADQVAGTGAFGAVPVFTGTLLIAAIALIVAIPVGLLSAIYLVEFANRRVRGIVKPILEILAGVPTVVYGFFAVLTVAPAVRQTGSLFGIAISPNSALVAGGVMGIMIIPFISSLADDALKAVPQSMRDGSLALGATPAETITKVLVPAALPGIMGGILLAASRAIGETMIVVMAAGLTANLTANPLEGVTTVTVQIVTLLIGDTAFDNPKTLSAFALGLVLFVVTLCLNVAALKIVQRYREKYE
ncbi:phosphate ABC transporter permease subunit PstC [Aliihoeflea sp. 40Bstr573]|uniref:phosphate ABC transporter permease subunit PstC n=1 Tax=Aliihoeflea sp. 40Bstr573 TaxID=2696467 RepID=UPI0020947A98|nr:phosphate ABC transporter permease subunit PstC [Aliihoeflea sp. 40Bstr573]MCO6388906.1 phosphate ABC transporter permease subunit PstC [Aliihoeflea sp. 40Bstr573]